jgi:hypothetical protein
VPSFHVLPQLLCTFDTPLRQDELCPAKFAGEMDELIDVLRWQADVFAVLLEQRAERHEHLLRRFGVPRSHERGRVQTKGQRQRANVGSHGARQHATLPGENLDLGEPCASHHRHIWLPNQFGKHRIEELLFHPEHFRSDALPNVTQNKPGVDVLVKVTL